MEILQQDTLVVPRERILENLSKKLNLKLQEDLTIDKKSQIVKFSVENELLVTGIFNDSIFSIYPDKITEVLEELIILIQKKLTILPKGKVKLEVSGGFVALTFDPQPSLVSINDSRNAYGTALCFLRGKSAGNYFSSLS